jgi:hypothetical protein
MKPNERSWTAGHEGNALWHSAHVGHSVKIAMIEAPRQSISPDGTGGFMTEQEKALHAIDGGQYQTAKEPTT